MAEAASSPAGGRAATAEEAPEERRAEEEEGDNAEEAAEEDDDEDAEDAEEPEEGDDGDGGDDDDDDAGAVPAKGREKQRPVAKDPAGAKRPSPGGPPASAEDCLQALGGCLRVALGRLRAEAAEGQLLRDCARLARLVERGLAERGCDLGPLLARGEEEEPAAAAGPGAGRDAAAARALQRLSSVPLVVLTRVRLPTANSMGILRLPLSRGWLALSDSMGIFGL